MFRFALGLPADTGRDPLHSARIGSNYGHGRINSRRRSRGSEGIKSFGAIVKAKVYSAILILVAAAIALGVFRIGTTTRRVCRHPSYPPGNPTPREDAFPSSYPRARETFVAAVAEAGGRLTSHRHPRPGPNGEPLFMDVAMLGNPDARRVLVIGSGTHGVEGFAGSGIQSRFLREAVPVNFPPSVKLILIHAINPYGLAYLRRFNEGNVDLNRNFIDHDGPAAPTNPDYARLHTAIAPASMSFGSEVASWSRLGLFKAIAGKDALQAAISQGQGSFSRGLFYAGTEEAWSNHVIRSVLSQHLANAEEVMFIDLHTGLGEYAQAELITQASTTSPEFLRAKEVWGNHRVRSSAADESVSVSIDGLLTSIVFDLVPPPAPATAVTLEFGTLPGNEVFAALRAENWLHHHGGEKHPRFQEIKVSLLKAFHPGLEDWEDAVWQESRAVFDAALNHLAQ